MVCVCHAQTIGFQRNTQMQWKSTVQKIAVLFEFSMEAYGLCLQLEHKWHAQTVYLHGNCLFFIRWKIEAKLKPHISHFSML